MSGMKDGGFAMHTRQMYRVPHFHGVKELSKEIGGNVAIFIDPPLLSCHLAILSIVVYG